MQGIDWIVSSNTVLRPDVIVVCDGIPEKYVTSSPTLIGEILSPATAAQDQNDKRKLYEEFEVNYYFTIDPDANSLVAFERSADGEFRELGYTESLKLSLCENCEIELPVSAILQA